jgi:hypothetical protein
MDAPSTTHIEGTYRGQPGIHFLDPENRLNVSPRPKGDSVGAWRRGEWLSLRMELGAAYVAGDAGDSRA